MTDTKEFKEFKTQPCKKCKGEPRPGDINFACAGYHGEADRRRNPSTTSYSPAYLEDGMNAAHCLNYV